MATAARITGEYIAVASDIDGTLMRSPCIVSDLTRKVLHVLIGKRHIPFILATARHHVDMLAIKSRCNLPGYLLSSHGARVHDNDGKLIMQYNFVPTVAEALIKAKQNDADVSTSFYQNDRWVITKYQKEITYYYAESGNKLRYELFDDSTQGDYNGVFNVYYSSKNKSKLLELQQLLESTYGTELHILVSSEALEVMPGNLNKGVVIAELLKKNIYPNDTRSAEELMRYCVAFGDGVNDYEMLMMCGKGYVMPNAHQRLLDRIPENVIHLEKLNLFDDNQGEGKTEGENVVARILLSLFHITDDELEIAYNEVFLP